LAFLSACIDKGIGLRAPIVFSNTWSNSSIQDVEMFTKQRLLFIINGVDDVIVIPDNEHHILSEDSQLLFSLEKSLNIMRNGHETKCLDFGPVRHFYHHFVQVTIEVTFKQAALLGS